MIKIAQMLCPQRHCFLALAYDSRHTSDAMASYRLGHATREHMQRHGCKCAICGAEEFNVEIGEIGFVTMAEATPALLETRAANQRTRALLSGPPGRN